MPIQQWQQCAAQVAADRAMNNRWPCYMVWFAPGFIYIYIYIYIYIAPTQSTTEPMAIVVPMFGSLCDPMFDFQIY